MCGPWLAALLATLAAVQPDSPVAFKTSTDDSVLTLLQRESSLSRRRAGEASASRSFGVLAADKHEVPNQQRAPRAAAAAGANASGANGAGASSPEALRAVALTSANASGASNANAARPEANPFMDNDDPRAIEYLHSHTRVFIDLCTLGLLAVLILLTSAGCCLGKRYWAPAMVLASYVIWLPGLFSKDFSFSVAVCVRAYAATLPVIKSMGFLADAIVGQLPERLLVTEKNGVPGPIHESTRSMVGLLWDTGGHRGAILIALFAFAVPILKLLLLFVSTLWGKHSDPTRVRMARYLLFIVQMISKWASPDMFAFALLYYLFRKLEHHPLIETLEILDIGFSCYSIFCVSSVVSTLLIELPEVPMDAEEQLRETEARQASRSLIQHWGGRTALITVTIANAFAWAVLFFPGLNRPVLTLRLDAHGIMKEKGFTASEIEMVQSFINFDAISDMVSADVSFWGATTAFCNWFFKSYELTLLLALIMLLVFCILFTIVDMALLVIVACIAGSSGIGKESQATQLMKVVTVIKHLSMLDVCITGIFVVGFAAATYAELGVNINHAYGAWELLGTEAIHYTTYNIVSWSVKALEYEDETFSKSGAKSSAIEES